MNFRGLLFFVIVIFTLMTISCQKDIYFTESAGSLIDSAGNCRSVIINGEYKADSILGNRNFLEVGVTAATSGTYSIHSDTLNGYYFRAIGTFNDPGTYVVRLFAAGRPLLPGLNTFLIRYGISTCAVKINVQ